MKRHVGAFLFTSFLVLGCAWAIAQEKPQVMTNADVVKMVRSGVSEDAIIAAIQRSTPSFDLDNDSVIALKEQKVSDGVVLAMMRKQGFYQPPPPKPQTPPPPASRRFSESKWEIEVHGGLARTRQKGGWAKPPEAETFSLAGSGAQGYTSSRVSSWYFGSGAELLGLSSSLDPVLTTSIVKARDEMLGFRVSHALNKWVSAEFTFDRGGKLAVTGGTRAQVEAARKAFLQAWTRLDVPGNTPPTSISMISDTGGHQTFTTGAIVFNLPGGNRIRPYVTGGGGVLFSDSGSAAITLAGSYGGPSAVETDTVRLSFAQANDRAFTGVFGVGIKVMLTSHLGVRLDGRAYFYKNPFSTRVSANHTNTPGAAWVVNATGYNVPFLQRLSGPGVEAYSTLSGPAISGLRTFYASGFQRQIPVTVGLFWRF